MKIYEIVFSPTGGTRKAADILAKGLSEERSVIDLSNRTADFGKIVVEADSLCVIAVPSYGGRAPEAAIKRIKMLNSSGAAAVLMAVYGNRAYEDTLIELYDAAKEAGFSVISAVASVAEHSIVRSIAKGRPDENDEAVLRGFADKIKAKFESGSNSEIAIPGNRPYKSFGGVPMKPKAGKSCAKCGVCAAVCPVGAIPAENPAQTDTSRCISCMRCIAVCPQTARSVSSVLLRATEVKLGRSAAGYKKNELFI